MAVVNRAGAIVLLNLHAEKQFGSSGDELVELKVTKMFPKGFAQCLISDSPRSAEEAETQQIGTGIELSALRKNEVSFLAR